MNNKISRKEAIQKLGKYGKFTALTAFGTFAILNPQMAQAFSDQGPFGNEKFNPNGKTALESGDLTSDTIVLKTKVFEFLSQMMLNTDHFIVVV